MQTTSNWSLCSQGVGELLAAHPSGGKANQTCYLWSHLNKISGFTSINFNKFTLCRWFTRSATKNLIHAAFILFHFFLWHSCFIQIFQSWCNLNLKRFLNLTWSPFVYISLAFLAGDCHIPKGVSRRSSQPWQKWIWVTDVTTETDIIQRTRN